MHRKTKIICTIGPAVDSLEKIRELVRAGMNVARLNCSHGDWPTRRKWVEWVRQVAEEQNVHIGILLDLSGPKFRLGAMPDKGLQIVAGDTIWVGNGDGQLPIPQPEVLAKLQLNVVLLIADGDVSLKVLQRSERGIELKCNSGGLIKSRQGITVVGATFEVPAMTEKDIADLEEGGKLGVEFVALSYVKSASDIIELGERAEKIDSSIQIIAKIEMRSAVKEIDAILRESDGIMVARGDLGLQMAIEEVPLVQKKIISLCHVAGKPVITATQMMESMVQNPRPTRAEATDVANAILDGTDAIMLSGETASGNYPIEAVTYMHRIAEKTEGSSLFTKMIAMQSSLRAMQPTESVANAACNIAHSLSAKAIMSFSTSGFTARMVAKFRPKVPILCASYRIRTARQVSLLWGVRPLLTAEFSDTEEMISRGFIAAIDQGILKPGDLVVITAGIPVGRPGTTNLVTLMQVHDPREIK